MTANSYVFQVVRTYFSSSPNILTIIYHKTTTAVCFLLSLHLSITHFGIDCGKLQKPCTAEPSATNMWQQHCLPSSIHEYIHTYLLMHAREFMSIAFIKFYSANSWKMLTIVINNVPVENIFLLRSFCAYYNFASKFLLFSKPALQSSKKSKYKWMQFRNLSTIDASSIIHICGYKTKAW